MPARISWHLLLWFISPMYWTRSKISAYLQFFKRLCPLIYRKLQQSSSLLRHLKIIKKKEVVFSYYSFTDRICSLWEKVELSPYFFTYWRYNKEIYMNFKKRIISCVSVSISPSMHVLPAVQINTQSRCKSWEM